MSEEEQKQRLNYATQHVLQILDEVDVGGELILYTEDYNSVFKHRPLSGYLPGVTTPIIDSVSGMSETQAFTATTPISSVEITENAKGEPRVTVKVYNEDVERASIDALLIYQRLVDSLAREGI